MMDQFMLCLVGLRTGSDMGATSVRGAVPRARRVASVNDFLLRALSDKKEKIRQAR